MMADFQAKLISTFRKIECPHCASTNVKVQSVHGIVRYCKCRDKTCGKNFKAVPDNTPRLATK